MVSLFPLIKKQQLFRCFNERLCGWLDSHFSLFFDILLKKTKKKRLIYNESSGGTTFACSGRSAASDSVWVDGLPETSSVLWIDSPIAVKNQVKCATSIHRLIIYTALNVC